MPDDLERNDEFDVAGYWIEDDESSLLELIDQDKSGRIADRISAVTADDLRAVLDAVDTPPVDALTGLGDNTLEVVAAQMAVVVHGTHAILGALPREARMALVDVLEELARTACVEDRRDLLNAAHAMSTAPENQTVHVQAGLFGQAPREW